MVTPTQKYLDARAVIAGDLYLEGKISNAECFRLCMDASLGHDTGPVVYLPVSQWRKAAAIAVERMRWFDERHKRASE